MSTLEEMKDKIKKTKKNVITKTKEKMRKIKDAAKEEISDKAVKVATVATMATGFAGTANAQSGNTDGSTQMAQELNYKYAHNNDFHFKPVSESERAMLEGSAQNNGGGGRTASFTQERQRMASQQTAAATTRGYATGPVYRNVQLEYSPVWSDGLKPGLIAFTNPTEYGKSDIESYVYYYRHSPDGSYNLDKRVTRQTAAQRFRNGTYQYAIPHNYCPGYGGGIGIGGGGHVSVDVGHGGVGVNVGGIGRNGAGGASVRVGRGGVSINVGGVIRGGGRR